MAASIHFEWALNPLTASLPKLNCLLFPCEIDRLIPSSWTPVCAILVYLADFWQQCRHHANSANNTKANSDTKSDRRRRPLKSSTKIAELYRKCTERNNSHRHPASEKCTTVSSPHAGAAAPQGGSCSVLPGRQPPR
eukprot:3432130-Amphidinium_carterae.1